METEELLIVWKKEAQWINERYQLAIGRLAELGEEELVAEIYRPYFRRLADFFLRLDQLVRSQEKRLALGTEEECRRINEELYAELLGEAYEESYANPAVAVRDFGPELGRMLSFFHAEARSGIVLVYEERGEEFTALCEELLELYQIFVQVEAGEMDPARLNAFVHQSLYYFISDYADVTVAHRTRELLDEGLDFAVRIILDSELTDLRYLYRYGEYISENERAAATFLNSLPEEKIKEAASVFSDGYLRGFALAGKDLSQKRTVNLRYPIGYERILREVIYNLKREGLSPICYRRAVQRINCRQNLVIGYQGTPANPQFEYDHRYDEAVFLDSGLKERKLAVLKCAFEEYAEAAAAYAGPALLETFGEEPFAPLNKEETCVLSEKQERLLLELRSQSALLTNTYIDGETTSFAIMSLPLPEIGADIEEIFAATMELNALDVTEYGRIQETLIAALDQAEAVHVKGKAPNGTDLTVMLAPLAIPEEETRFENCLADVNIPLGEVFTSPRLSGTDGVLCVSDIYINEIRYRDLELHFQDGRTTGVSCKNYAEAAQNEKLVRDNLLQQHDWLPMGEFAIGTNTRAYAMTRKYQILDRMKILIVEKMGPHFAIGDTCFSHEEELVTKNPDGKRMIAKDNEVTLCRREEPARAYFNCHIDITLPYDELASITLLQRTGEELPLFVDGRFVLPGTELLNQAMA